LRQDFLSAGNRDRSISSFPGVKRHWDHLTQLFNLEYSKGINKLLGSDVDFDKWKFTVFDDVNLQAARFIKYRLSIGGFLKCQ